MSVCLLALCLQGFLPHRLALVWENSSPSNCLLLNPLGWCVLPLEFLHVRILKPFSCLPPTHFFFCYIHNPFIISLIGSTINYVKSCTTPGHSFSPAEICFWSNGSHGFFYNNSGNFSDLILLDFHDVFSISILFHRITNTFQRIPCVISFKGPYEPLEVEAESWMLCLEAIDHFDTFGVELMGSWVARISF